MKLYKIGKYRVSFRYVKERTLLHQGKMHDETLISIVKSTTGTAVFYTFYITFGKKCMTLSVGKGY